MPAGTKNNFFVFRCFIVYLHSGNSSKERIENNKSNSERFTSEIEEVNDEDEIEDAEDALYRKNLTDIAERRIGKLAANGYLALVEALGAVGAFSVSVPDAKVISLSSLYLLFNSLLSQKLIAQEL